MSTEAMKQALDCLQAAYSLQQIDDLIPAHAPVKQAVAALRQAIEQAEKQEPVAWQDTRKTWVDVPLKNVLKEKREWVGLTDEEMRGLEKQFNAERVRTSDEEYLVIYPGDYWAWQRAIEARLKEKNGL